MKIKKIKSSTANLHVSAQGCGTDCKETNVWVGRTDGNDSGCVLYDVTWTPRFAEGF